LILADSNIWIDRLRNAIAELATLLLEDEIVAHPLLPAKSLSAALSIERSLCGISADGGNCRLRRPPR
jgi:hypothetical protein